MDTPTTPAADPYLLNEPNRMDPSFGNASNLYSNLTTSNLVAQGGGAGPELTGIACPACTFQNDPFMIQCEICGTELQDADSIAFMLHRQQQHQRSISQLPSTITNSTSSSSLPSSLTAAQDGTSASKSSGASKILNGLYNFTSGSSPGSSKPTTAEDSNSVKLSFRAGGIGHFHTLLKAAVATKAWEVKKCPADEILMESWYGMSY